MAPENEAATTSHQYLVMSDEKFKPNIAHQPTPQYCCDNGTRTVEWVQVPDTRMKLRIRVLPTISNVYTIALQEMHFIYNFTFYTIALEKHVLPTFHLLHHHTLGNALCLQFHFKHFVRNAFYLQLTFIQNRTWRNAFVKCESEIVG